MNTLLVLVGRSIRRPQWVLPYVRWRINLLRNTRHQSHRYTHMLTELRITWPGLRSGGITFVDDAGTHTAVGAFYAEGGS